MARKYVRKSKPRRKSNGRRRLQQPVGMDMVVPHLGRAAGIAHNFGSQNYNIVSGGGSGLGARSAKRQRTASGTMTKRKRSDDDEGSRELTARGFKCVLGTKRNLMKKLVSSSKQSIIFRYGAIDPFMNTNAAGVNAVNGQVGGGAYSLNNYFLTVGNSVLKAPLHVFDITGVINTNAGASYYPYVGYELQFNGVGSAGGFVPATASFNQLNGRTTTGNGVSQLLQYEKMPGVNGSATNMPLQTVLQEYANIKLLCYGTTNYPCEYRLTVFQIKDDWLHPYEMCNATLPNTNFYEWGSEACAFYEGFVSESIKHPIASQTPSWRKHITILKEDRFILQSRASTEALTCGHTKEVNMWIPMYRKNNYNYLDPGLDPNILDPDAYQVNENKNQPYLKPKARIYFAIQATNSLSKTAAAVPDLTSTPTYDMMIRTKFAMIE